MSRNAKESTEGKSRKNIIGIFKSSRLVWAGHVWRSEAPIGLVCWIQAGNQTQEGRENDSNCGEKTGLKKVNQG